MKKQLRNLAFAAAVVACGSAMAQDEAAVLTPKWQTTIQATGTGSIRYGQGYNGKLYMADKDAKAIITFDGTTKETYVQNDAITGIALTIDQAGNIVVNTSFPGDGSGKNFVLIDKDKNVTPFSIPDDEMETGGRVDQLGRAIGDFTSEEGGVFYVTPTGHSEVYGVSIVNGEVNYETFGFAASTPVAEAPGSSTTIAQPRFNSMADMYTAVEDGVITGACNAFYVRSRSTKNVYWLDGEDGVFAWVKAPATCPTTDGFDWFELQGKFYVVLPYSASGHSRNFQIYSVDEGKTVAYTQFNDDPKQAFQQYSVEKVDEYSVNIYNVMYQGANVFVSCTPFEVERPEEPADVVYFDNNPTNWANVYAYTWNSESSVETAVWPGVEVTTVAEGIYTYVLPEGVDRIIFNNGMADDEGQQTEDLEIVVGKTYDINSEGVEPPTPTVAELYVIGNIKGHSWETSYTGGAMTKVSDGLYEIPSIEFDNNGGDCYFSFITKTADQWDGPDGVNSSTRYGATKADSPIAAGESQSMLMNWNAWKIAGGVYKIIADINNMTITVSATQGIDAIDAEDAPAVYFNLQGVEVANPANGLYIVKRGNKVTKEMVK